MCFDGYKLKNVHLKVQFVQKWAWKYEKRMFGGSIGALVPNGTAIWITVLADTPIWDHSAERHCNETDQKLIFLLKN